VINTGTVELPFEMPKIMMVRALVLPFVFCIQLKTTIMRVSNNI